MCFDRNINENRNVKFFEWEEEESHFSKVHIFWEGHKILRNLPLTFDCVCTAVKSKGKISQNFVAFSEYMNFKVTDVFSRPENLLSIAVGGGSGP